MIGLKGGREGSESEKGGRKGKGHEMEHPATSFLQLHH
jgi:hypothetical protein